MLKIPESEAKKLIKIVKEIFIVKEKQDTIKSITLNNKIKFLLYYEKGLSTLEIAELFGVSKSAIEDRINNTKRRAKRFLKEELI